MPFLSVKTCADTHIRNMCGKTITMSEYRAGVYIIEEVRGYVVSNGSSEQYTTHASTSAAESPTNIMTDQGLGQLRYLGGRCIAKMQYATVTRLRRVMHVNCTAYTHEKSKAACITKPHSRRATAESNNNNAFVAGCHK